MSKSVCFIVDLSGARYQRITLTRGIAVITGLHHPIREQPLTNAKTDTLQSTLYSQAVPPRPVFHSSNASKPASPSAQGLDAAQSTSQSRGRWLKDIILPKIGRWTRSSRDRIAGDIASTSPIASSSAWIHPHSRSEVSLRIVEQHSRECRSVFARSSPESHANRDAHVPKRHRLSQVIRAALQPK